MIKKRTKLTVLAAFCLAALMLLAASNGLAQEEKKTIIVTAEGLADPNADEYKRDKAIMADALRRDAMQQCIEKAVGCYVESHTLVENYAMVRDKILTRTRGLIKEVKKVSPVVIGEDGFAHMLMTAEVYVTDIKDALREMSKMERVSYIRDYGDPKISLSIWIKDADRGSGVEPMRSEIAENILAERIQSFGYRIVSEDMTTKLHAEMMQKSSQEDQVAATISLEHKKAADFFIQGVVKFTSNSVKLKASGLIATTHSLTAMSLKCIDTNTGEQILPPLTKIPRGKSWNTEDEAMLEIGQLIGEQFSKDLFEDHLMEPTKIYQLEVLGLPSYKVAKRFRKEFIGFRPVIDIKFKDFDKNGLSIYEVYFSGSSDNFNELLDTNVIDPLNTKIGESAFSLDYARGRAVRVVFKSGLGEADIENRLNNVVPASLVAAPPERLKDIIKSEETLKKVAEVAPDTAGQLKDSGILDGKSGQDALDNF